MTPARKAAGKVNDLPVGIPLDDDAGAGTPAGAGEPHPLPPGKAPAAPAPEAPLEDLLVARRILADALDATTAPASLIMRVVSDLVSELELLAQAAGHSDVTRAGRGMAVDVIVALAPRGHGTAALERLVP